jgi:DNA-binding NarL/FixJ family response regulator
LIVTQEQVQVVVADTQALFREAVTKSIERMPGFRVVGAAGDQLQAIAIVETTRPDVVLVADSLEHGGQDAARLIGERAPQTRVVLLAEREDVDALISALEVGVRGCVTKSSKVPELIESLNAVARGETVIPRSMVGGVIDGLIGRDRERQEALQKIAKLTPREREVLALLAEGLNSQKIASRLVISPETARTHIQKILNKLGIHSRLAAATFAAQPMRLQLLSM